MNSITSKQMISVVLALVIAILSFTVIAGKMTDTNTYSKTIETLNEKEETVMKLTAASAGISAAISLLPNDAGSPIAEKLSDLSTGFLIVLCAIFLEKYLLIVTGYATWKILIPIACLLFILYCFKKSPALKMLIQKIVVFAIAIILIVPASVRVTNLIENAYGESIQDAISQAESAFPEDEEIEEETEADVEEEESNVDSDSNILSRAWASVVDTVDDASEAVKSAASSVGNYLAEVKTVAKEVLIHFLRVLALMIVTSCIIPILVLIFFLWLIKIILNLDINISAPRFDFSKKKEDIAE